MYAIGGFHRQPLALVEAYDPAINAWTAKMPMPTARSGPGVAAATNGKIGRGRRHHRADPGWHGGTDDPATNNWTAQRSMPTARNGVAVAAASNGKIYAVGGTTTDQVGLRTLEEYDPVTNTWTTKAPTPTIRTALALATASNGKLTQSAASSTIRYCRRWKNTTRAPTPGPPGGSM